MFRHKNKIILLLVTIGLLAVGVFAFAQDLGLNEFAGQTGLTAKPLTQIIAEIVRVFLSVLGVIAVILILYAGWLWMTSMGDPKKIDTAKKLMINGVIGLIIILASLAITQFIIGSLERATGARLGGVGGPGGGGGGGLGADAFVVRGISPQGNVPIRNIIVRASFSHSVDATTVNGNILIFKKSDNSLTPYTFAVTGDKVEMTPSAGCETPNQNIKCFEANTAYKIQINTGLKDAAGKNLACGGLAPNCSAEFTAGSLVDTQPPQVVITYPDAGQSVPRNSFVDVWARATDDAGVSNIDFFADGGYIAAKYPSGATPKQFDGNISWNTTGVTLGNHNLSAKAYDIDSNSAFSPNLGVVVRPEHCFNAAKDSDETGIDCGGRDCAICSGGQCGQNSDCASGSCQNGVCVDTPLITNVSPTDGAPGTYVTISGKYFGQVRAAGTVTFLGGSGTGDDVPATLAPCGGAWRDTQIVVIVPQGAVTGPIEVKNSIGRDATNDPRGPALPDYAITPTLRPGICELNPTEGKSGSSFTILGDSFGSVRGNGLIKFGNVFALPSAWSSKSITAIAPVLQAGANSVIVNQNGVDSNAVNFNLLPLTSGTKPNIAYIDPSSGPVGEYITIFGSDFGENLGTVEFLRQDGVKAIGDADFPAACGTSFWHNTSIIVKVPDKFSDGASTKNVAASVQIRRPDNAISNAVNFSINSDTPRPGICKLSPASGPVGTSVNILGERFGTAGAVSFYNNVSAAPSAWGSEMVAAKVPTGALTGPVKITTAGKISNGVNFTVGDCRVTPGICTASEQCCNGSCLDKAAQCQAVVVPGAYGWRISTGIIPQAPHVVEDCQTGTNVKTPSPSPWDSQPGGNSVCVNAIMNVRFDTRLDPSTIIYGGLSTDTISLYKCTGAGTNPCATKTKVGLSTLYSGLYPVSLTEDGAQFYPQGNLEKNTQYLVELTTGIRAAGLGGGYMEERTDCGAGKSYCFKFKTINSDGLCKAGGLLVSPLTYTSTMQNELLDYSANVRSLGDVCLLINAGRYVYFWESKQPSNADILSIGQTVSGKNVPWAAVVKTYNETQPDRPAKIDAKIASENVSGQGELTVDFTDPQVTAKWPACDTACVNSIIGAQFNTQMDAASIISGTEVWKCKTENCDTFDGLVAGNITYSATDKKFTFTPSLPLEVSRYHLVRLNTQIVKSVSNVYLIGANSGKYFSWRFKTRADATPCTVNKINLRPQSRTLNYIGETTNFDSEPVGAPDSCSPEGQPLNPYSYNWAWSAANSNVPEGVAAGYRVASLVGGGVLNVLPPAGAGCSDRCLHTGSRPNASVCGNKLKENGEDCDDGNAQNGDGCSNQCLNEGNKLSCGNKLKENGEDCDDGNTNSNDGCSDICLHEGSDKGGSKCGNRDLGTGEDCVDGNTASGDGCSSQCLNEGTASGIASCGNGVAEKNLGEDCDDKNTTSGDGCSEFCLNEGSIAAKTVCGNNSVEKGEDCDDGNIKSGDGCSDVCLNEGASLNYAEPSICGNNTIEKGEDCDAGAVGSNVDPRQYAKAEAKGKASVSATLGSVVGAGSAEVMCIYTTDDQCPKPAGKILGVGVDNCCYPRPQIIEQKPLGNDICRNTIISIKFNQLMDASAGAIIISERKGAGACARGTISADGLWCESAVKVSRQASNIAGQTEFSFNLQNILQPLMQYKAEARDFKSASGVAAYLGGNGTWTFTTAKDICLFKIASVTPNPLTLNRPEAREAVSHALTADGTELSSIPGVYDWKWTFTADANIKNSITLGVPAGNTVGVTAQAKNGDGSLTATAELLNIPPDIKKITGSKFIFGSGRVIVFLCESPWPNWSAFPFIEPVNNFSAYYCRDGKELLPYLDVSAIAAPTAPDILKELLLVDKQTGNAVGVRVYQNLGHLSASDWYKMKLFAGSPSNVSIDGYGAIVDGRTTYASFANTDTQTHYTNVLVLSYDSAAKNISDIYNQLAQNLKFNVNILSGAGNTNKCSLSAKDCASDLDCDTQKDGVCNSAKQKITRDVSRLADFNILSGLLEKYKIAKGAYPQLLSGTFLRGLTVSPWSSWQAALGNDLSYGLPADPLNRHAICNAPYDPLTCWDGAAGKYLCPAGSRVYRYTYEANNNYKIASDLEYKNGAGWVNAPGANFIGVGVCSGQTFGASAGCGDGLIGAGEECELGQVGIDSCVIGTKSGVLKWTCDSSCKKVLGACVASQCGDGVVSPGETCDDGQANGKYGFCRSDCSGIGANCGDGITQLPKEQCDWGVQNGAYLDNIQGCSWDCRIPGPYCGDKIINGNEQCDGNTKTSKDVEGLSPCGKDAAGYDTVRTKNCDASCRWSGWGECLVAGSCGNSAKEGAEQCDDGNSVNTDSCTTSCKLASCGDGYVRTGKEICDSGAANGSPCAAGYGLTCNYCGTNCAIITKTGGFCGDRVKNGPEECDWEDFGTLSCSALGYLDGGAKVCAADCKFDVGNSCVTVKYEPSPPPEPVQSACIGEPCDITKIVSTRCNGNGYQYCVKKSDNCTVWGDIIPCSSGQTCSGGSCVAACTPNCSGKTCGSDGCGGSCGTCSSGYVCNASGQCVSSCTPSCSGKQCGPDGCGGSCGTCGSGYTCNSSGQCASACTDPCSTLGSKKCVGTHDIYQCVDYGGCYNWSSYATCSPPNIYVCQGGTCITQ